MKNKMRIISIALLAFMLISNTAKANTKSKDIINYIKIYYPLAIQEMNNNKIPASITLSQGILESEFGKGKLAVKSNNHFGIKCKSYWTGEKVYHDDDELQECFRKYETVEESYLDHSLFLVNGARYASLFDLKTTDYKGWAHGLKKAGYATNPYYAIRLIHLIETYELYKYDNPKKYDIALVKFEQERLKEIPIAIIAPEKTKPTAPVANQQNKGYTRTKDYVNPQLVVSNTKSNISRKIFKRNKCKYIISTNQDTWHNLSQITGVNANKLITFNDISNPSAKIESGSIIYITKKRKSTGLNKKKYIIEHDGETIYEISQKYAIRATYLSERNSLMRHDKLPKGKLIEIL